MKVGRSHGRTLFLLSLIAQLFLEGCTRGEPCVASQVESISQFVPLADIDSSFGNNGLALAKVPEPTPVSVLHVLENGELLVAGLSGSHLYLARFSENGSFIKLSETKLPTLSTPKLVFQSDGKLLLAGLDNQFEPRFVVLRYTADGVIDSIYADQGKATISTGSSQSLGIRTLTVTPANELFLIASHWSKLEINLAEFKLTVPVNLTTEVVIVKLTSSGSPVSSFGQNGLLRIPEFNALSLMDSIGAAASTSDGTLYLGGDAFDVNIPGEHLAVAKILPVGSIDLTFGNLGRAILPVGLNHGEALDLIIQQDGKILATGRLQRPDHSEVILGRYLPSGIPDLSFGTAGLAVQRHQDSDLTANALMEAPDHTIYLAGFLKQNVPLETISPSHCAISDAKVGRSAFLLSRYLPDGSPDTTFGDGGTSVFKFPGKLSVATTLSISANGHPLVGGDVDGTFAITRFLR